LSVLPALAARLAQRTLRSHGDTGRPWASVAVVLAPEPDSILLIQRADRDSDVWSGHLAFPGGRRGPNDPDLLTTARRETLEEVGFDLGGAQLIGQLDDLATRGPVLPPLVVRPFVFTAPAAGSLTPNREVAAAWWVPLETFSRSGVFGPTEYRRYGTLVRSTGYHLPMGVLWGMTERILTPLLELAQGGKTVGR